MMKLFWSSRSPFGRKVTIVARELGIENEIELVRVVTEPAKPSPEVMRFNPLGKVPTLIVGDAEAIYDSHVICAYLAAGQGDTTIFPSTGEERWAALCREALADGIMETDIQWIGERKRTPGARNDVLIAACRQKIVSGLDAMEADAGFLAEGKVAIGQIAAVSAIAHLQFRFPDEPWLRGRPRLAAWFEAFSRRPSVAATAYVDIY